MAEKSKRTHSEIGPMGRRVASNVRRLRDIRGLTTSELAERLAERGVPMNASAITKIEKKNRRVTVDELHALASALGVRTVQLLRDPDADPMSEIAALADELLHGPFALEIVGDETGVDIVRRTRREATTHIVRDRLAKAREQGRPTMAEVQAPETDRVDVRRRQAEEDDDGQS